MDYGVDLNWCPCGKRTLDGHFYCSQECQRREACMSPSLLASWPTPPSSVGGLSPASGPQPAAVISFSPSSRQHHRPPMPYEQSFSTSLYHMHVHVPAGGFSKPNSLQTSSYDMTPDGRSVPELSLGSPSIFPLPLKYSCSKSFSNAA